MTSLSDKDNIKKTKVSIWHSLRTTIPATFLIPLIISAGLLSILVNHHVNDIAEKDFKDESKFLKQVVEEEFDDYFQEEKRAKDEIQSSLVKIIEKTIKVTKGTYYEHYKFFVVDKSDNFIDVNVNLNQDDKKQFINTIKEKFKKKNNKEEIIYFPHKSEVKKRGLIQSLSFNKDSKSQDSFEKIKNLRLFIFISEKEFMNYYNHMKNHIYLLLIVTFASSALLGLLLSNRLIKPILQLNQLAKQIEQGSITFEAEKLESIAKRSDEIGEFAAVFKDMSQEIFAREQSLKGKVEELRQESDQAKKVALASQLSGNVDVNTLLLRSQKARQKVDD